MDEKCSQLLLRAGIILTQYQKVRDQSDTFEKSMAKLTQNVKVRDQTRNLPNIFLPLINPTYFLTKCQKISNSNSFYKP